MPPHPQPGGIGYRHWLGLVVASPDTLRLPASAVTTWRGDRMRDANSGEARLIAAGDDMDIMKARAFVECEMPLPASAHGRVDALATRLVLAAGLAEDLPCSAVRAALFNAGATMKLDSEPLSSLFERLWVQQGRWQGVEGEGAANDGCRQRRLRSQYAAVPSRQMAAECCGATLDRTVARRDAHSAGPVEAARRSCRTSMRTPLIPRWSAWTGTV